MKIIDYTKKGNVVRFYLGSDDCNDYWGDDWDDRPASCNAGTVYYEYIKGIADIAFPYDYFVLDAESDWHYNGNEPYCKEDYKDGYAPCLIIVPPEVAEEFYEPVYSEQIGNKNNTLVYYNDDINSFIDNTKSSSILLQMKEFTYNEETRSLYDEDGNEVIV